MLRTRLWMGAVLVALAVGVLVVDPRLAPGYYPFLFVLLLGLAELACFELLRLLPAPARPSAWLCHAAVAALVIANWLPHLEPAVPFLGQDPWHAVAGVFAAVVMAAFLVEMATFQEPGRSVTRIATAVLIAAYLGVLPSFLAQLRWRPAGAAGMSGDEAGTLALALAVFVPKCGDIGAYFTGRFLGRNPMAPVLSPKKTWEGAAGGLAASVAAAAGINRLGPVLPEGWWGEAGFGVTVGIAGLLGDLAESLIKRDCRQKDASQAVPGFGGVLDVVDAVLFAAPVAYWWLV
jgi:phosphatidate cytidylyltransferase